jgi:hypothetical protein
MKTYLAPTQSLPLKMVGGTAFGSYPKISSETTFNMFISDNWLVPFAGYVNVAASISDGIGRDIYSSDKLGKLIVCIGNRRRLFCNKNWRDRNIFWRCVHG